MLLGPCTKIFRQFFVAFLNFSKTISIVNDYIHTWFVGITVVILLKSHKTMHSRAEMRKQRHLAKESSCHVGNHSGMKSFVKAHTVRSINDAGVRRQHDAPYSKTAMPNRIVACSTLSLF